MTQTWLKQVTFWEEGSWVSMSDFFFRPMKETKGLERDLPWLLLATLVRRHSVGGMVLGLCFVFRINLAVLVG